jgi:regulation of enolase protein 1 (concanavalin A-like superfamily)
LTWNPVGGASYNVKRSFTSGGPYTIIASAVSGTNFTDAAVTGCQNYYYVVTITNGGFESLPSNEAGPLSVLPPQFSSADIGVGGVAGSAAYCSGQFTVTGSGGDIWGNADAFQFVYAYVPVTTNCDIRARVVSVQNTSSNAKAALMIRESLAADSRHVMADVEPSAGMEFIWRDTTGGNSSVSSVAGTAPNWIRLTRTNNTFTAYWSADGNVWSQIGLSTNINMAAGAYVGLAVCSHNNGVLNTSVFDNVTGAFGSASGAPVLNPVANQTVNVGQPVSLTAHGQDTNSPPYALAFSLLNAPSGASLNQTGNNDAAFYWRPRVPDANSTNQITLAIANNAWPSLSATQSFTVVVNPLAPPQLSSAGWSNGKFVLQVNGQSGPDYAIETSTNLTQWSSVYITNSPALPFNWTESPTNSPQRFYRIKAGPPLP